MLRNSVAKSSVALLLAGVEGLKDANNFNVKDFVGRLAVIQTEHAVSLVYWAVPLFALRKKFNMPCKAFNDLKRKVVEQQFKIDIHSSTVSDTDKKKKNLMRKLTEQVAVSELAMTEAYTTEEQGISQNRKAFECISLLQLVLSKFESFPGFNMNMRAWAKQIRIWKTGPEGEEEDTIAEKSKTRLRNAVRAWHEQTDTKFSVPAVATNKKDGTDTSQDTDTPKKTNTSTSHDADSPYVPSGSDESSSDTSDSPGDHGDPKTSPKRSPNLPSNRRKRQKATRPLTGARDPAIPPSGAPLPKPPPARSRPKTAWTTRKKKARDPEKVAVVPQSTLDPVVLQSDLPLVAVVLLADLQVRKLLMDVSPLLSVNFFGASDVCGDDDQFPTALFKLYARHLIASTRDYTNCVPVTGGKVTGQDLISTLNFHCHFAQAVAVVCIKGEGGVVTVKSVFHPPTRVKFGEASGKAEFVIVFPGQKIVLDDSAKKATWCLVGMAVTGVSFSQMQHMDAARAPPTLVEENRRFRMHRLLKLAPMNPQRAVLLEFDDNGNYSADPRLPQNTNVMMESFFFLQGVFQDILSMDQARELKSGGEMAVQAVDRLPSILERFKIMDNYQSTEYLSDPRAGNDLEMEFELPHIQAFLGGPWSLVELFCGKFHGYFHARAGSLYVHAVTGSTNEYGDPDRMKVKITSLCKQGDLGAATLYFNLT